MVEIRKASENDAKAVQEILNLSWFTTYKGVFTKEELNILTTKWHNLNKIREQLVGNEYIYLIAEENNNVVGVCSAYPKGNGKLNIEKLHILPKYKGLGIGSKLLDYLLQNLPETKLLELEVVRQNKDAINFYKKRGFSKVKEMEFVVNSVTVPCYLMEKSL